MGAGSAVDGRPSTKITISSGISRANAASPSRASAGVVEMGDVAAHLPRTDGMQLELELGHDPEVAAAAAERPQELRIAVRPGLDDVARRR